MKWYSQNNLAKNWKTFIDVLLSLKDPYQSIIDNPFIAQYNQLNTFDSVAWNYVWNNFLDFAFKHPLDIFVKSHPYQFRKQMKTNVAPFIKLTYQKFQMNDDVNPKMIYHYIKLSVDALPIKFKKYSLPFMQQHVKQLGKWFLSDKISKIIKGYYLQNSFEILKKHSRHWYCLRDNYVDNYLVQFALYNPKALFNKKGLFKLNKTKNTFNDVFNTAYWHFADGDYDKSLINKYIVYKDLNTHKSSPKSLHQKGVDEIIDLLNHKKNYSDNNKNTQSAHFTNMTNGIGVNMALQAIKAQKDNVLRHLSDYTAKSAEQALGKIIDRCNAELSDDLKDYYNYDLSNYQSAKVAIIRSYNKMIELLTVHHDDVVKDIKATEYANRKCNAFLNRVPVNEIPNFYITK